MVPFGDTGAAAEAILILQRDPALRDAMGARGHQGASTYLRWPEDARAFVAQLEQWAGVASGATPRAGGAPRADATPRAGAASPVSARDRR